MQSAPLGYSIFEDEWGTRPSDHSEDHLNAARCSWWWWACCRWTSRWWWCWPRSTSPSRPRCPARPLLSQWRCGCWRASPTHSSSSWRPSQTRWILDLKLCSFLSHLFCQTLSDSEKMVKIDVRISPIDLKKTKSRRQYLKSFTEMLLTFLIPFSYAIFYVTYFMYYFLSV